MSGGSPVPALCGVNNHQHLIYSVTPDSGPSQLSIILSVSTVTMAQSSNARLWNIRIYQAGTSLILSNFTFSGWFTCAVDHHYLFYGLSAKSVFIPV